MFSSQGFGATPLTQAGGQDGGQKAAKQEEKHTCLPVTVRMIETAIAKAEGGDVLFNGIDPSMLMIVGMVESVSKQAQSLEFVLNDSTGRINGRYYANGPELEVEGVEAGRYISVSGNLRTSPEKHISATTLRLVQSADEISYHMIESAHAALKPLQPEKPLMSQPMMTQPMDISAPKIASQPPAAVFSAPTPAKGGGLSPEALKAAIVAYLQKEGEGKDEGLNIDVICKGVSSSNVDVKSTLAKLVADGDVFNTIDDNHFSAI